MRSTSFVNKLVNKMNNKNNDELEFELTPNQIKAGTTKSFTHSERQAFWQISPLGETLGFSERWTLPSLIEGITPENLHPEVDNGDAVGKEVW